jgi:hypothetical protein
MNAAVQTAAASREQRKIWVALGKGSLGVIRQQKQTAWPAYVDWQRKQYVALPITAAAYAALSNDEKAQLKKRLAFSLGAKYQGTARKAEALELRESVNIDIDKQDPAAYTAVLEAARETGCAFLHVGSSSNEVNGRRSGRLIFPLSRAVEPRKEFPAVSRKLAEKLGLESIDPVSHRVNQICYVPAHCSDTPKVFEEIKGPWLDVQATLAEYSDWQDPAQWPRKVSEQVVSAEASTLGDPRDKPNLIGAFCRTYDFVTAIETFDLPYDSTSDESRWTPHGASSSGGARLYGPPNDSAYPAWMYNDHEHGLSPKRNICAYDAVRLYKFGSLDNGLPETTPLSELPSTRAMDDWIRGEQPAVVADARKLEFANEFEDLGDEEPSTTEKAKPSEMARFKPVPVGEFSNGPEPEWIVDGVLPRAELAVVYGESGCGKSFFVTDMSLAIARGVSWQGRETKQGKVVYICGESPGGFRKRFRAYAHHHGLKLRDLDQEMFLIGNAPNLLETKDVSELCAELRVLGPLKLIVVDTLARATPGANENSGEDMGKALKRCQVIHQATGALVVLVHHSGKDQSRGARGWSGIRAATDTEIEITRLGGTQRRATLSKQRDGEDGLLFGFELINEPYGYDEKEHELSSLVVKPVGVSTARQIVPPPTAPKQLAVWRALQEAGGSLGMSELLARAADKITRDPDKSDRRRQYARVAVEALEAKGAVVITNDTVSLTGTAAAEFDSLEESPVPESKPPEPRKHVESNLVCATADADHRTIRGKVAAIPDATTDTSWLDAPAKHQLEISCSKAIAPSVRSLFRKQRVDLAEHCNGGPPSFQAQVERGVVHSLVAQLEGIGALVHVRAMEA